MCHSVPGKSYTVRNIQKEIYRKKSFIQWKRAPNKKLGGETLSDQGNCEILSHISRSKEIQDSFKDYFIHHFLTSIFLFLFWYQ